MDTKLIDTALSAVAKLINEAKTIGNYYDTKSLSEITKLTRVEPLCIINRDCLNLEYMKDINNSLLNIFTGYYLQAINILTKVNDVEVVRILDKLNPDRDGTGFLLTEQLSTESLFNNNYQYKLPGTGFALEKLGLSLEADDKKDGNITYLQEVANLSVGKMINVNINYNTEDSDKGKSVTLPINVRLLTSIINNDLITNLLTGNAEDNSLSERFHSWRAGRISLIGDLLFCNDLINEHRKLAMSDDTGTIQEIIRRVNNSKKYGLLTKNPSLVSASNIFVITEDLAAKVQNRLGGKLSNSRVREKLFENTYAMIIAVIDREYERVNFYTRGISASTDLSVKEIKASNQNKGPDIMDIMKSFNMGTAPSF